MGQRYGNAIAWFYGALISAAAATPDPRVREQVAEGIRRGYNPAQILLGYPQERYLGLLAVLTEPDAVVAAVHSAGWHPVTDAKKRKAHYRKRR